MARMSISSHIILALIHFLALFASISTALTPQLDSHAHQLYPLQQQSILNNQFNANNQTLHYANNDKLIKLQNLNKPRRLHPNLKRKLAAGGGGDVHTLPPTQYPTVTVAGSLFTVGTSTSATWKEFTQTFAATALGTWALGPTPRVGTIGLGTLQGSIGDIKTASKRAVETSMPKPEVEKSFL
ncbi:hypothetical protein K3495_g14110 [Podosphaera aphanis]|nr:hypothetical protein K3495_g14110 [Podosphaera aphanis]